MRDEHGEITEWIGASMDIEDQRRARAELELRIAERTAELTTAQKRLWEGLDAATGVSVIAGDVNGDITLVNAGAQRMLGYRAAEVVGKLGPEIFRLESEVIARGQELSRELGRPVSGFDVFAEHARRGGLEPPEWTYLHKDGHAFTVTLDVTAARTEAVEITGSLGIATDLTERKRAVNELRRLQQFHAAILAHIRQGIHSIDADGNIIFENPAAAQMLECMADELIGRPVPDAAHHQADGNFYRVNEAVIHSTLCDGEVQRVSDEFFWRKDGSLFPVELTPLQKRVGSHEVTRPCRWCGRFAQAVWWNGVNTPVNICSCTRCSMARHCACGSRCINPSTNVDRRSWSSQNTPAICGARYGAGAGAG